MKSTYKEYVVLGVVGVLLALFLFFRNNGHINYKMPVLPSISQDSVTSLSVSFPEKEASQLHLEKKQDDSWVILPQGYKADPSEVERILSKISSVKLEDLVSSSKNYSRYDLDEKARVSFQIKQDQDLLRELFVGKVSPSGRVSYLLLPEDPNVYSVAGNLRAILGKKTEDLRDRNVLNLESDKIIKISLSGRGHQLVLTRSEDDKWVSASDKEKSWDQEKIDDLFSRTSPLKASSFLEDTPKKGDPLSLSFFEQTEKEHRLNLLEWSTEGVAGTSSDIDSPFRLSNYAVNKILESLDVKIDS